MLTFYPPFEKAENLISMEKYSNGENASDRGAFSLSLYPQFVLRISRKLGVCKAFMIIRDALCQKEYRFDFTLESIDGGNDIFRLSANLAALCEEYGRGLFYLTVGLFIDDEHTFYLSSVNNVDFTVCNCAEDARPFRLLLYADGFSTPEWAKSAVMYHIFVDRFCKGDAVIPPRDDCRINPDWDNGIPEYAAKNGEPLANNTFFGGNLYGVAQKLDYLKELGVNVIYLSPVFKAYSNHKYDTGDYEIIDEMFGGKQAFDELREKADSLGIRIIFDGVFNHTGDDSKYFNRYGKYNSLGAYQSKESPYYGWYGFERFPDEYECWWGIKILPKLMNTNPELQSFFTGQNGIVRKWLREGISGWRLDVADELPSEFLDKLRLAAKAERSDSLIIGEVWENAADKVAYSEMRRYFLGGQLDSVMNYPIKNAIISFVTGGGAEQFYNSVTDIYSSYPPCCSEVLMNILGTHDTERILTVLSGVSGEGKSNAVLSTARLTKEERERAVKLLKLASVLQFTLPGMPSIYYGDEAGMEGYHDPFCRRPFPWGRENAELTAHYKAICKIKREFEALHGADMKFLQKSDGLAVFVRQNKDKRLIVAANASDSEKTLEFGGVHTELLSGARLKNAAIIPPKTAFIIK